MSQPSNKPKQKNVGMSWAQAVRDIVVTSMNRGQLPVLGLIAVLLLWIWKLEPTEASRLFTETLEALKAGELFGYALFIFALGGWFIHAKSMRKMFSEEAKRIGRQKSDLQSALTGENFQSSNRRSRR